MTTEQELQEMKKELKERIEILSEANLRQLLKATRPVSDQDIINDIKNNPIK